MADSKSVQPLPTIAKGSERAAPEIDTNRDAVIARIRTALRTRSGKAWSVTGGRGTAWGWIRIDAPPARCTWRYRLRAGTLDRSENYEEYDSGERNGHMSPAERAELAALLGLNDAHFQGVGIASSSDHRREYIDRAEGRAPLVIGAPYWD